MKAATRLDAKIKEVRDELKRTQLFLDVITAIRDSGWNLEALAEEAGVADSTIYFWLNGYVKHPRIDTICKVAAALGFDVRLYRVRNVKPTARQRGLRVVK